MRLKPVTLRWQQSGVLMLLVLGICSSCGLSSERTYSINEQHDLYNMRLAQMLGQIGFSFSFVSDRVHTGQSIYFVAVFTNTTDYPIVFREPREYGLMEAPYPDTTLLFAVEPIQADIQFRYPLDTGLPYLRDWHSTECDEFVTMPAHDKHEIRLELWHLVFREGTQDLISLPPGQYLVKMTYINDYIGCEVERNREIRYTDLGAWVGKIETKPVLLTITRP